MELFSGTMVIDIMAIGKMVKSTEKEQNYGKMEESTSEYLKMISYMVKEVFIILMVKKMKENL